MTPYLPEWKTRQRFRKVARILAEGGFLFSRKSFWASPFTPGRGKDAVKGFAEGKSGHGQVLTTHPMLISGF
jgi:hypothetical protein